VRGLEGKVELDRAADVQAKVVPGICQIRYRTCRNSDVLNRGAFLIMASAACADMAPPAVTTIVAAAEPIAISLSNSWLPPVCVTSVELLWSKVYLILFERKVNYVILFEMKANLLWAAHVPNVVRYQTTCVRMADHEMRAGWQPNKTSLCRPTQQTPAADRPSAIQRLTSAGPPRQAWRPATGTSATS